MLSRADLGLATPWAEPKSDVERKLAEIWRQVVGVDSIGTADNFFDLGGDSFMAATLAAEIAATFGTKFSPGDIINLPTIASQASAVASSASSQTVRVPRHIVVGQAEGSKPPLFMVHGAAGFSFFNRGFIDGVGHDRPVYLFQAPGLDGHTRPLTSVEAIASAYVESMREVQPVGAYHIAGMCSGCFIALEMCNQLADAGQTVARLILLDPQPTPHMLAREYAVKRSRLNFLGEQVTKTIYDAAHRVRSNWRGPADAFERELRRRAKMAKRQNTIRRRRAGEIVSATPAEKSYSPEAMLEASLQLHTALKAFVPRRYAGTAAILAQAKRADEIAGPASFWRDYLNGIDFQPTDATRHHELFNRRVGETAHFVRKALESPT
jgi:thioesterase domain-containing protein/acyl carrier protein